ncbi:hypothetical protein EBQ74_13010 [bacterium]|nr:hypothetical protein [bacterium]
MIKADSIARPLKRTGSFNRVSRFELMLLCGADFSNTPSQPQVWLEKGAKPAWKLWDGCYVDAAIQVSVGINIGLTSFTDRTTIIAIRGVKLFFRRKGRAIVVCKDKCLG